MLQGKGVIQLRKVAMLVMLLMVVGMAYGWCYTATVDNVLDAKSKSDIRPVEDVAKLAGMVNKGVNTTLESKYMSPIMKPIDTVRLETLKGAKTVTNTLWDALTFKSFREKK